MRPDQLRPLVRGFGMVSERSGLSCGDFRERRNGLEPATRACRLALADWHRQLRKISIRSPSANRDDPHAWWTACAVPTGATIALALARTVERVDVGDLDAEDQLDRVADLDLVGVVGDDERVDVLVVVAGVRLLRDDRPDDDVVGSAVIRSPRSVATCSWSLTDAGIPVSPFGAVRLASPKREPRRRGSPHRRRASRPRGCRRRRSRSARRAAGRSRRGCGTTSTCFSSTGFITRRIARRAVLLFGTERARRARPREPSTSSVSLGRVHVERRPRP